MRLLCVIDKNTSTPLFFRYLPGNIVDVSTLKTTMSELKEYGVKSKFVLMDAGYFSQENITDLYKEKINFLTRLPSSNKIYKNLVNENVLGLENSKYAHVFGERGLFIKRVKIELYKNKYKAFAYIILDPERKGRELSKIVSQKNDNTNKVNNSLKLSGVFILISSFKIDENEVVPYYYLRQQIEQVFGIFKDDLNVLPLRTHNDDTIRGYLFLMFVSLIVFLECRKVLEKAFTLEQALMVMRNLKCEVFKSHLIIHELTKKQKEVTKLFGIKIPNNLKITDCCA